jgi:hypothetical protein
VDSCDISSEKPSYEKSIGKWRKVLKKLCCKGCEKPVERKTKRPL